MHTRSWQILRDFMSISIEWEQVLVYVRYLFMIFCLYISNNRLSALYFDTISTLLECGHDFGLWFLAVFAGGMMLTYNAIDQRLHLRNILVYVSSSFSQIVWFLGMAEPLDSNLLFHAPWMCLMMLCLEMKYLRPQIAIYFNRSVCRAYSTLVSYFWF